MKKVIKILKKSINLSNIDVLTKILEYERLVWQIFWSLILFILSGLTIWLFILNLLNYFQYEVVSKIENLYERPSEFPVVTLCDSNPLTSLYAQSLMDLMASFDFYDLSTQSNLTYSERYKNGQILFNYAKIRAKSELNDESKTKLGFYFDRINACKFDGRQCDMKNDFHWYYSYEHGNCWQFNSGLNSKNERVPIKKTNLEGQENGLEITVWALMNLNKNIGTFSDGLVLFVHNQSYLPSPTERIFLRPGKESRIEVGRIFSKNQPRPFSECQDLSQNSFNSEFYAFILSHQNASYRQLECLDLCRQKVIIDDCGCYFPKFDMLYESPPCLTKTQGYCLGKYTYEREILTNETLEKCVNECPLECESVKYRMKLSTLKYPNEQDYLLFLEKNYDLVNWYKKETGKDGSYEEFRKMSYSISVFYSSMHYTKITQSPKMYAFDLFSQLGGCIGVFIGISVFHLIEILEIILSFFSEIFVRKNLLKINP